MSDKVVAKRYALALTKSVSASELEQFSLLLNQASLLFGNKKFIDIVKSPLIEAKDKSDLIIDSLKEKPTKLINLIKLLADKNRLMSLPVLAEEIRVVIAEEKKSYQGVVMTKKPIDKKQITELSSALSKKLGVSVELDVSDKSYDGIKVAIDDLGVEIDFSKEQIKSQILGHILRGL